MLKSKNLTAEHNITVKKLKDDNTSLIEGLKKFKDNMITSNKLKTDQDIEMKKLRDFSKWLKNISKEDVKRFESNTHIRILLYNEPTASRHSPDTN